MRGGGAKRRWGARPITPQSKIKDFCQLPYKGSLWAVPDRRFAMYHPRNKKLLPNAQSLRKNMTKEERHLWYDFLRYCTPRFRRQEIIGSYIADFYCDKARLIIELDGSQHMTPDALAYDAERTAYFYSLGITVVRYYNTDIQQNFDGVCQHVLDSLKHRGVYPSVSFADSSLERGAFGAEH